VKVLNLGCGNKIMPDTINVDIMWNPSVNRVVDLSNLVWPWEDNSIDIIYASHILEHFSDQKAFIDECIRILKPHGLLQITGPHSSCVTSIGCLGHYRTYSYNTFNDYLCKPWYMYKNPVFRTIHQKLSWWYEKSGDNVPAWLLPFISVANFIINTLIALSPRMFENWWWVYVGGAREVIWVGEKL